MTQGCVFFPTTPQKLKLMGVKSISASGVKQLVLISLQGFSQALAQTLIYPLLKFSILEGKIPNFQTHIAFYFSSNIKLKACRKGATVLVLSKHPLIYRAVRFPQNLTNWSFSIFLSLISKQLLTQENTSVILFTVAIPSAGKKKILKYLYLPSLRHMLVTQFHINSTGQWRGAGYGNTLLQLSFLAVKNPREGAPWVVLFVIQHWAQQLLQIPPRSCSSWLLALLCHPWHSRVLKAASHSQIVAPVWSFSKLCQAWELLPHRDERKAKAKKKKASATSAI